MLFSQQPTVLPNYLYASVAIINNEGIIDARTCHAIESKITMSDNHKWVFKFIVFDLICCWCGNIFIWTTLYHYCGGQWLGEEAGDSLLAYSMGLHLHMIYLWIASWAKRLLRSIHFPCTYTTESPSMISYIPAISKSRAHGDQQTPDSNSSICVRTLEYIKRLTDFSLL